MKGGVTLFRSPGAAACRYRRWNATSPRSPPSGRRRTPAKSRVPWCGPGCTPRHGITKAWFSGLSHPSREPLDRRRELVMTNPLISPTVPNDAGTQPVLTAGDAQRIATAIDAELAHPLGRRTPR